MLAGCGGSEPAADAASAAAFASADSQSATIADGAGASATIEAGTQAAARMPDYARPYPGAVIEASMTGQSAGGAGGMLSMVSQDKPDVIIEHYRKQMAGEGLKLDTEARTPQGMILAGSAADGRALMVTVSTRDDGKSAVALVAGHGR